MEPSLLILSTLTQQTVDMRKTGLAILCPVTSQVKGYPFEVLLPEGLPVTGAILSDQVKNLDWHARDTELICTLSEETMSEVLEKLGTLLTTT